MDFDAGVGRLARGPRRRLEPRRDPADLELARRRRRAGRARPARARATETLTAARFDGGRAYVVTAVRRDPLWVVDVRDPAHPALLGHLEMPGQLDYIEPRGDRLVALGHTDEAGGGWQLAVSLFDVSGGAPRLLDRVPFGGEVGWITAPADDVRKAFQVLAAEGLVVVPFQSWDADTWRGVGGTQLLALDGDRLADAGFLPGLGAVLRAVPLEGKPHHLVAFSEERLQVVDATDRAAPRELAALDLARPAWDVALAGGAVAALAGDWYSGAGELTITTPDDPDAPSPLARVRLDAPASRLFARGAVAWLLVEDWRTSSTSLEAIDLSDPASPRRRGRLVLRPPGSGWGYVSAALSPTAPVLAVHVTTYAVGAATASCRSSTSRTPTGRRSRGAARSAGTTAGTSAGRARACASPATSGRAARTLGPLLARAARSRGSARPGPAAVRERPGRVPRRERRRRARVDRRGVLGRPEAPRTRVHALVMDGGRARLVGTIELEGGAAGRDCARRPRVARRVELVRGPRDRAAPRARPRRMRAGDGLALEGGWPWPLGSPERSSSSRRRGRRPA